MKKFENLTKEELWKLRNEITFNSLYHDDYRNSFGLDKYFVCDFFDGWGNFLQEKMKEDGHADAVDKFFDYFDEYDNADKLWDWFCCFEDFSWVEYDLSDMDSEELLKLMRHKLSVGQLVQLWNEHAGKGRYSAIAPMETLPEFLEQFSRMEIIDFHEVNTNHPYWTVDSSSGTPVSFEHPMDHFFFDDLLHEFLEHEIGDDLIPLLLD